MDYVFISHASDDKKRLLPYLEYLLERLPADVGLWIDSPSKIDSRWHRKNKNRLKVLKATGNYQDNIKQAVRETSCVLLFWSTKADEKERTLMGWEIQHGWKKDKLVIARLDRNAPPFELTRIDKLQMHDVSLFPNDNDDMRFDGVVDGVLEILAGFDTKLSGDNGGQIPPKEIPFQANRTLIKRICRAVREYTDGKRQHHKAYVVLAGRKDAHDMFLSRLSREGAERVKPPGKNSRPDPWTVCDRIEWTIDPDDLKDDIRLALEDYGSYNQPVCMPTDWSLSTWHKEDALKLEAWLSAWNKMLAKHPPQVSIIPILTIILEGNEKRHRTIEGAIAKTMADIKISGAKWSNIQPCHLDRLQKISCEDARNWAGLNILKDLKLKTRPQKFVDGMFRKSLFRGEPTFFMEEFADRALTELLGVR